MTGFGAFLGKELTEIRRTWRLWVIPGMLVFFGITSPIIAALTPALVQSMATSQPGLVIRIPPPTARDAYVQFIKSLDQLVLIAIIIQAMLRGWRRRAERQAEHAGEHRPELVARDPHGDGVDHRRSAGGLPGGVGHVGCGEPDRQRLAGA